MRGVTASHWNHFHWESLSTQVLYNFVTPTWVTWRSILALQLSLSLGQALFLIGTCWTTKKLQLEARSAGCHTCHWHPLLMAPFALTLKLFLRDAVMEGATVSKDIPKPVGDSLMLKLLGTSWDNWHHRWHHHYIPVVVCQCWWCFVLCHKSVQSIIILIIT